jgi:hypothetical protein
MDMKLESMHLNDNLTAKYWTKNKYTEYRPTDSKKILCLMTMENIVTNNQIDENYGSESAFQRIIWQQKYWAKHIYRLKIIISLLLIEGIVSSNKILN